MDGFNIYPVEKRLKVIENKAGIFSLLSNTDSIEVLESVVNPGRSILCEPYESKEIFNLCYIVKGRIRHTKTNQLLTGGDYYTYENLDSCEQFIALEKTTIIVIRNKEFFDFQTTQTQNIMDMMSLIQQQDSYTEGHCNRTGNLAGQIATQMNLSDSVISDVIFAGKIHDIGKVKIPGKLLRKTSKLSDKEYSLIKNHPKYGYDIVMNSLGNHKIAKIILQHHERLDGSGYPSGLYKEDILIESQIVMVADNYDAMVSQRSYGNIYKPLEAYSIMEKEIGQWYDQAIVFALKDLIDNKSI